MIGDAWTRGRTGRGLRAGAARRTAATGALAALIPLLLTGCEPSEDEARPDQTSQTPQQGGTAVLCVPSQPESLNPFVTPDQRASDLAPLLFTPVVRYGPDGEIEPYLARSWSWENDRRRLVLRLRADLRWHDGTPVRAGDVAWTLTVASQPDYGYPEASGFSALEHAEARDSVTVAVDFREPYVRGLEPLARLPVLPQHLLGDIPADNFGMARYHRGPVGSGPFRFAERRQDGTLVFERFDGFPEGLGVPRLDRIAVRVIPETSTMMAAFRRRGMDACITTANTAARLQDVGGVRLEPLRPAQVQVLVLNTAHRPFDDPRVRRALSAALNRAEIATAVSPVADPAGSPVPQSSPWAAPDLAQPDDDPWRADSLLEATGWARSDDGGPRRNADGEPLRFTLMAPPDLEDPLTVVQADLREVGVEVELRFMEWSSYVGTIRNPETRPAAMALGFQLQSLKRPDLRGMLHTEGPSNLAGYSSRRVDSLLDIVDTSSDRETLAAAYRQLQRVVQREVPLIFTISVPRVLAVGPRLQGVSPRPHTALSSAAEWWVPEEGGR